MDAVRSRWVRRIAVAVALAVTAAAVTVCVLGLHGGPPPLFQPPYAWLSLRNRSDGPGDRPSMAALDPRFVLVVVYMRTDEPAMVMQSLLRHGVYERTPLFWFRAEPIDLDLLAPSANAANADAGTVGCYLSHMCVAKNVAAWLDRKPLRQAVPPLTRRPPYILVLEADAVVHRYVADLAGELDRLYDALQNDLNRHDPAWTVVKLSHWGAPAVDRATCLIPPDASGPKLALPASPASPPFMFRRTFSETGAFGGTQAYLLNPVNLRRYLAALLPLHDAAPMLGSMPIPFHIDTLIDEHATTYVFRKPLFGHGPSFHTREAATRLSHGQRPLSGADDDVDASQASRPLRNLSSLFDFYCHNDLLHKLRALLPRGRPVTNRLHTERLATSGHAHASGRSGSTATKSGKSATTPG